MVDLRAVDKALRGMPKRIQYDGSRIRENNMPFLTREDQCHFYWLAVLVFISVV
jgi:hypothetical protein